MRCAMTPSQTMHPPITLDKYDILKAEAIEVELAEACHSVNKKEMELCRTQQS